MNATSGSLDGSRLNMTAQVKALNQTAYTFDERNESDYEVE
jgi:hypothetical protein